MGKIEKRKLCTAVFLAILMALTAFVVMDGRGLTRLPPIPSDYHPAVVTVEVVYENGTPASGATVSLHSSYDNRYQASSTDETGTAILKVGPASWGPGSVKAQIGTSYFARSVRINLGPDDNVSLRLTLERIDTSYNTLQGVVKDKRTGDPLSGVTVSIYANTIYDTRYSKTVYTSTDGSYSVTFPRSTSFYVEIIKRYYSSYTETLYIRSGKRSYVVNADLIPYRDSPPVSVEATVYDSTHGVELGGFLSLTGHSSGKDHATTTRYMSYNSTGRYFYTEAYPGEYKLEYRGQKSREWNATMLAYKPVIVNNTAIRYNFTIPVPKLRHVYINVTNGTAPVENARVYFSLYIYGDENSDLLYINHRVDAYTGSDGHGHFGIPAGMEVEFYVYKYGYEREYFTVPPGNASDTVYLNITLERSEEGPAAPQGDVSIKVVDALSGVPVPGAEVDGWGRNGDDYIRFDGWTGDDGYLNTSVEAGFYEEIYAEASVGWGEVYNISVEESGSTEVTIFLERWNDTGSVPGTITLVDENGDPLPGQWVTISGEYLWETYRVTLKSDERGVVHFMLPPGLCTVYSSFSSFMGEYRLQWKTGSTQIMITPEGENRFTITMYPTFPLQPITGFVKDAGTGKVIKAAKVDARSVHNLEETRRNGYPGCEGEVENVVDLYRMVGYSVSDGFYRVWGVDEVRLRTTKTGYFPKEETINLGTRAGKVHDIYLERIPEYTSWIAGQLVDQDMNPIPGYITILDRDHTGYYAGSSVVEEDGLFNVSVYPGNFTIFFYNETLYGELDVQVPESGLGGIVLKLIPKSTISGTVRLWNSSLAVGINVTLVDTESGEVVAWVITGEDGTYEFEVERGDYRVVIEGTALFEGYESNLLELTGWNHITLDIILARLTHGAIMGKVLGDGGPYDGVGIEGAEVGLYNSSGMVESTVTNSTGAFLFTRVLFGDYHLSVDPPIGLKAVLNTRSGYLSNNSTQFSLDVERVSVDVHLPYVEVPHARYFNITGYGPTGDGVPLDEAIWISFSEAVNRSSAEGAITITPNVGNISFGWGSDGRKMYIYHDNFEPNTTYQVVVAGTILSMDGNPLWNYTGVTWGFTTGQTVSPWRLTEAHVSIGGDKSVNVSATGKENITVYVVIEGVGSFEMEEVSPGHYYVSIPGDNFDWNRTYSYHFSDREGGDDKAPHLSGEFRTPVGPSGGGGKGGAGGKSNTALYVGLLLLLLIIGLAAYFMMSKGGEGEMEE